MQLPRRNRSIRLNDAVMIQWHDEPSLPMPRMHLISGCRRYAFTVLKHWCQSQGHSSFPVRTRLCIEAFVSPINGAPPSKIFTSR
jgi:hypothetical protein